MAEVIVILGSQLVPKHPAIRRHPDAKILMIEADDVCRKYRYHKHKLMLTLASMREYADSFTNSRVRYVKYKPDTVYKDILQKELVKLSATKIIWMHTSDRGPNRMLQKMAKDLSCETLVYKNKMFLTSTKEFGNWLESQTAKTPLMETFYRWQRRRLNILVDKNEKPIGGIWNYDHDNRKPLPKNHDDFPSLPKIKRSKHIEKVARLIDTHFSDNPGTTENFWLPTTRRQALNWLESFIETRFSRFGPYEDAMKYGEPFLYHSVLSPLLNIGLLTPKECVAAALKSYELGDVSLQSIEGFVRQIIGWREFMYGLYWWKSDDFKQNFFGFTKPLEDWWYNDSYTQQNLPIPLEDALKKVHAHGYNHHIERLMVLGNWFLLSGYSPKSVYDWFMSMYVDAYEWVMIPNVLGMSQYADGGMLATKPYVSGGNYLQKMGRWWNSDAAARESEYTKKYWQFLYDNREKFEGNPRMSLVVRQAEKHIKL